MLIGLDSIVQCIASSGCLQLLEIYWNLKTLEILKLYGPLGNFCVTWRWSTALVSNHDKTGYRIAYLRNWSPFFIFATAPCCAYHVFVLYLGKLVDSVHCVACQSNENMSWIFLEIPPGISWKFVQLNLTPWSYAVIVKLSVLRTFVTILMLMCWLSDELWTILSVSK